MKTNILLISLVCFSLLSVSLASADFNLFMRAGSPSIWANQEYGLIQTPTTTCSDQSVPKQVCTPAPDYCYMPDPVETTNVLVVTSCQDPYTETIFPTEQCTTVPTIVRYEKIKGVNTPIWEDKTTCTVMNPYNVTHESVCTNQTTNTTSYVLQEEVCEARQNCYTDYVVEEVCQTTFTNSYNRTLTEVAKAWSVNSTNFVMEFESSIMAENIYTQSKTPKLDGTVNYLTNFKDKTKLDNKLTHYAKKTLVFPTQNKTEQVLNMEDRIVELEGFANQLMTELCLKNKNAYTWC